MQKKHTCIEIQYYKGMIPKRIFHVLLNMLQNASNIFAFFFQKTISYLTVNNSITVTRVIVRRTVYKDGLNVVLLIDKDGFLTA